MRKKYKILTLGFCLILSLGLILGFSTSTSAQLPNYSDELQRITDDIRLLNLVNGLELNQEQMEFIIQKAGEAEQLKAEILKEIDSGSPEISSALNTLQELKVTLLKGENIPDELKKQAHRSSLLTKEITVAYQEQVSQLASEIEEILQPHQLCALESYVPCLIPPKPWAYGQEDNSEAGVRQLTKIREIPAPAYEKNKEKIANQMLKQIKLHAPRGYSIDEEAEKEWIISIFEEARGLSDIDFAIGSTALAEKLKSHHTPPKSAVDITIRIEKFLLNPQIIPLLKSKLSAAGEI